MTANLTISGMTAYDPSIWDNLQIPAPPIDAAAIGLEAGQLRAAWTIDKHVLINHICLVTMSMPLAFPDADFLKSAIQTWSSVNLPSWQRVFDTLFFRYNPIWNKDGTYSESGSLRSVDSGTNTTSRTAASDNVHYTHGYDTQNNVTIENLNWTHADKDVGSGTESTSLVLGTTNNQTDSRQRTEQGNIGVTTTQAMIEEERKLAMLNIFDIIAESFKHFFCIMLY